MKTDFLKEWFNNLRHALHFWRLEDLRVLWRTLLLVFFAALFASFVWNGYILYEIVREESKLEEEGNKPLSSKIPVSDLNVILRVVEARAAEHEKISKHPPSVTDPSI